LTLALLGTLVGCIPTERELRMERDLLEMKRRLAEQELGLVRLREDRRAEQQVEAVGRQVADLQAALDALRVEFQSAQGRSEDLSRERRQLRDDLGLMRDDLALKITALEDRLARLDEKVVAHEQAHAAAPAPLESPEALYARGLELIQKQQDYPGGRKWLQEFLQRNPQSELAPNAMYWIGEAWYGEKQYENAILQFQDVIQKYGDHPKAASALLKQGLAFHALGDVKNARAVLKKLIDSFPLAEETKKAKEKLAEWGKP
jgi:tol-pal system protein YbgF